MLCKFVSVEFVRVIFVKLIVLFWNGIGFLDKICYWIENFMFVYKLKKKWIVILYINVIILKVFGNLEWFEGRIILRIEVIYLILDNIK